ncbi:MAG TPA: hypothetical protein VHI78_03590 [Bacteroidales bacterium]|jgi:hypothetical protein|nr:hypothetical protein [Bacteroidales bacterium]
MNQKVKIKNIPGITNAIPFKVPDGYFETFPDKLVTKLPEKQVKQNQFDIIALNRYAAAAILVIVAVISVYLILRNPSDNIEQSPLQSEISVLVENDIYSFNEEMIYEAINSYEAPNSEEVIDYLLNEDLNESELINAL